MPEQPQIHPEPRTLPNKLLHQGRGGEPTSPGGLKRLGAAWPLSTNPLGPYSAAGPNFGGDGLSRYERFRFDIFLAGVELSRLDRYGWRVSVLRTLVGKG